MLSDNIKKFRKEKKISQTKLGDMLGVSGAYIQQLEKGVKKNPSIEVLLGLSSLLDIPLGELLDEEKKIKYGFDKIDISKKPSEVTSESLQNFYKVFNRHSHRQDRFILETSFYIDTSTLTNDQVEELMDSINFTIKLKLEEFKNKEGD